MMYVDHKLLLESCYAYERQSVLIFTTKHTQSKFISILVCLSYYFRIYFGSRNREFLPLVFLSNRLATPTLSMSINARFFHLFGKKGKFNSDNSFEVWSMNEYRC